jgi:hypothetical protein
MAWGWIGLRRGIRSAVILVVKLIFGAACGVLAALASSNPWWGLGAALAAAALAAGMPVAAWWLLERLATRRLTRRYIGLNVQYDLRSANEDLELAARHTRNQERQARGQAERYQRRPDFYRDFVRGVLAEHHPGRLMFNPPDQMRLGQTERVEVRAAGTLGLDAELLEHLRGHGEPRMEEIPTAPLMAMALRGDGFVVTSYSDEEQVISEDAVTTWEFDIRAKKRGEQRLVLSVSLRVPVLGWPSQHRSIPVREVTIDVRVGAPARVGLFVSANWQWFVGTSIAIAAVVVAALIH